MLLNNKEEKRRAIIVLTIFVLIVSVYFIPVLEYTKRFIKYNEDIDRNTTQIIGSRGFQFETHYVNTGDGYVLTVNRIINPFVKYRDQLRPILLQHGFQNNANVWLINSMGRLDDNGSYIEENNDGPVGNTLGFVLAVNGYDVWLANMRGNMYSLNHTKYKTEDPEFWRFSIDEMIEYDLPAMISYIQMKTSKKQMAYIGHSQGTYMMFGLLATRPEYSQVIKPFIALSPVPFMGNSTSPLLVYGKYIYRFLRSFETSFLLFGKLQQFYSQLCDSTAFTQKLCFHILHFFIGIEEKQFNFTRTGVFMANLPSGSSCWNAAHLLQNSIRNKPMRYDHGDVDKNKAKYMSPEAPDYDMSAINSTDIALVYTANDWLNALKDIALLKQNLRVKLLDDYLVPDHSWNHMELVWAIDAGKLVNTRVLDLLYKYNS